MMTAFAEQNTKKEEKVHVADLGYFYPNTPVAYGEGDMVIFEDTPAGSRRPRMIL